MDDLQRVEGVQGGWQAMLVFTRYAEHTCTAFESQAKKTTMATTLCPDCGNQVSPKADRCVHCGSPLEALIPGAASIQTIQATGKRWKAFQLIGRLLSLAALGFMVFMLVRFDSLPIHSTTWFRYMIGGIVVLIIGELMYWYARLFAWWHHG